ncbi:hypothetical protein Leryth_012666, partial [Lithospermum erythrorhizon]
MEKGKAIMGSGRRWAVDFSDNSNANSSLIKKKQFYKALREGRRLAESDDDLASSPKEALSRASADRVALRDKDYSDSRLFDDRKASTHKQNQ